MDMYEILMTVFAVSVVCPAKINCTPEQPSNVVTIPIIIVIIIFIFFSLLSQATVRILYFVSLRAVCIQSWVTCHSQSFPTMLRRPCMETRLV